MARWQKVLIVAGGIAVAIVGFLTWYKFHYSMGLASSFEVKAAPSAPRVLIATQGSDFKDAVVAGVVDRLKERSAYVKVIDISGLADVHENDWSAIVVMHTWEMHRPPPDAQAFVDRTRSSHKAVILSTSGAGDFKMEGVDAISSASTMADVPTRVAQIADKVDAMLDAQAHR